MTNLGDESISMKTRLAAKVESAWLRQAARRELSGLARSWGQALYLVGGAVRDVALGREVGDWDLAGHDAVELAWAYADQRGYRLVMMHEEMPTARVIVEPGAPAGFLDFAELRAPTIEDDLRARDFTINAIAWDIRGADSVVDPTGGVADLTRRVVRASARTCLEDDPLRTLRAFRLTAELGFALEEETAEWVRECGPRIKEVAGERVGQEMLKLFAAPHAADAIQRAEEVGVLELFIPPLAAMRGVTQGGYHHLDVLGHSLLALHEVERAINAAERIYPGAAAALRVYLADDHRRAAVRLAALLHDLGKPACRSVEEDGRIRFIGHAQEGVRIWSRMARQWALPGEVTKAVATMTRLHLRPLQLVNAGLRAEDTEGKPPQEAITLTAIRRLMRKAEPYGVGLMLLAAADRAACRGPGSDFEHRRRVVEMLDDMLTRYLSWQREQRHMPRLVNGRDLMRALGLEPGPIVGELLDDIAEAQAEGEVSTREEALALARRVLEREERLPRSG